jgi:hypothetical protein
MLGTGAAAGSTGLESELRVAGGMKLHDAEGHLRNPSLFDFYHLNDSPSAVQLCGPFSRLPIARNPGSEKADGVEENPHD